MQTPDIKAAKRRIFAIQDQISFNAADSTRDEYAARNLVNGDAAFCSTASYSNAAASKLACAANRLASIEAAQIELGADVTNLLPLNALIPLNSEAAAELYAAYVRAGTFRTRGELIDRLFRYEPRSVAAAMGLMGFDAAPAMQAAE